MNLYDIIELREEPALNKPTPITDKIAAAAPLLQLMNKTWYNDEGWAQTGFKEVFELRNSEQLSILNEYGVLPPQAMAPQIIKAERSFSTPNLSSLQAVSKTPKTNTANLRAIANKLGFVIIPSRYMSKQAVNEADYTTGCAIDKFKLLETWFNVYVLCPIQYYDIRKHVDSIDLPVFTPTSASQTFMAIDMMIPMLRTMQSDIKELRNDYNRLQDRQKNLERQVKDIESRLINLEVAVISIQREQAIQRAEQENREKFAALQESMWRAQDPLMFCFPKNKSIVTDNTWAAVGPCWGPDLNDIIAAALDLRAIEGQRAQLVKTTKW